MFTCPRVRCNPISRCTSGFAGRYPQDVLRLVSPTPTPVPAAESDGISDAIESLIALISERFPENPLNEYWSPIATILLALAAVIVAVFSWRTSTRANRIVETHRAQDRKDKDARFRRGIAVDVREWLAESAWRAKFGAYYLYEDEAGKALQSQMKQIERRLEREGEENGLRLLKLFRRRLGSLDAEMKMLGPKEVAQRRHPSTMNRELNELTPLLDAWKKDPASIDEELEAEESGASARAEARLRALKKVAAKLAAK